MRRILFFASVPLAVLLYCVGCSRSGETDAAAEPAGVPGTAPAAAHAGDGEIAVSAEDAARLGEGFVVWESRRGGAWRIWRRDLSGAGLTRLSPDESGHDHCCAHVSPDGARVAYLSLPHGAHGYGADDEGGALHLVLADGSQDRVLEPRARTYGWGHRAAVWHDAHRLVFIDGAGETIRLDLESGAREVLAAQGDQGRGWLIGATLQAASSGRPSFSLYDRDRKTVVERGPLGGCEPYFTADGRWGYWIAGAGGPLDRLDLATRATATVLAKNDPRLPARQGYLYFPMVSPDGHLLAVGASPGEHDHQTADYDIFVMALDPATLEVVGNAVQLTDEAGPDRYPSPFAALLPLGRVQGEAPLRVDLAPPQSDGAWSWDFGDGARTDAARGEHTYSVPGAYKVEARRGEASITGRVTVLPALPPKALGVVLRDGGRDLVVSFDEPVDVSRARATLESGGAIERAAAGAEGRSLVLHLAAPLAGVDRVRLDGVVDRAQRPNPMAAAELAVDASGWPSDPRGLAFEWERADRPNTVWDASAGAERSYPVEARGRARLDHDFAMMLQDGSFVSDEGGAAVARAGRAKNEVTVELTFEPRLDDPGASGVLVWAAGKKKAPNLALEQRGAELLLTLHRSEGGAPGPFTVGRAAAGRRSHLVLSYTPGWLVAVLDGETVLATDAVQGDFFPWSPGPLVIGAAGDGGRAWPGTIEGIAIYDRALGADEAKENARRYRATLEARPRVERVRVEARRLSSSRPPALGEIAPYRSALVAHEYEVTRTLDEHSSAGGTALAGASAGSRIRVAHWAILDGETQPIATARAGETVTLDLEAYRDNRQLEGFVLADTLGRDPGVPLFLDVRP